MSFQRSPDVRASIAFVLGIVAGAGAATAIAILSRSAEPVAAGRDAKTHGSRTIPAAQDAPSLELAEARRAAARDREALRASEEELRLLRSQIAPATRSAVAVAAPAVVQEDAAITSYLGKPVPALANLDRKYSSAELAAVFRDLTDTLGFKVDKLAVDTSEFPFLVHGRIDSAAGAGFFKKIDAELRALPGYTYGGSVTGRTRDGSTYFVLNMVPSSAYPKEHAEAISRRLTVRLQMTADNSRETPP